MVNPLVPKRWHIYVVDLNPRVGSKPGKQRPCLAIQPDEIAEAGLTSTVVIPLTTKLLGEEAYPLRIRIPRGSCRLEYASDLMIDQILAWDNTFFREDLGEIPELFRRRVQEAIKDFLELH